jgi:hypothetical protein
MFSDKIKLEFLSSTPLEFFPFAYSNAHELLYNFSLRNDVRHHYEQQGGESEANPPWILERIVCSAVFGLTEDYIKLFGKVGVPELIPADPPGGRKKENYRFYLNVKNQLLEKKQPEQIRIDLSEKIMRVIEEYPNLDKLSHEFFRMSYRYGRMIEETLMGH